MPCLSNTSKVVAPKLTRVELPEFGEGQYVNFRSLRIGELKSFEKRFGAKTDTEGKSYAVMLLTLVMVDDQGNALFTSEDDCDRFLDTLGTDTVKQLSEAASDSSGLILQKKTT